MTKQLPRAPMWPLLAVFVAAPCAMLVTGCAPAVIAVGVGATAMVANDRRSTGAQVDDESIEFKVTSAAGTKWGADIHLNVTSYNGNVLLSGEVPSVEIKNEITRMATTTDRVKSVTDELVVGPTADLGARSNDTYVTSKVKARMFDSETVKAIYVKVVTERSVVYLMGIVSREDGNAAAQVAATTEGVARVVKLFEYTN